MMSYDQLGRPISSERALVDKNKAAMLDDISDLELKSAVLKVAHSIIGIVSCDIPAYDQLGRPISSERALVDKNKAAMLDGISDLELKSAVLKAAHSVVGIVSCDIPGEMTRFRNGSKMRHLSNNQVFMGSGTVIECQNLEDGKFSCIALTTSNLFTRSNGIQPADINVQVYVGDSNVYPGQVLACDFHYNLASIMFKSDAPLPPAGFRDLDDSFNVISSQQLLRPHSTAFKIGLKDMVIGLGRRPMGSILITVGHFSASYPELDCKELYSLGRKHQGDRGGPAINRHGEVIGIMTYNQYFLPSNVASRWWMYYKENRKFCRPCLGFKFANLHAGSLEFLEPFSRKFPTVSSGVIVTEVEPNSGAGLSIEDVIVECDSTPVKSTLQFFGKVWEKAGKCIELTVLRPSSGDRVNLNVRVDETLQDNFYRWPIPEWLPRPVTDTEMSGCSSD